MDLIEVNGDIKFYQDENGKQYQQIKDEDVFKISNGKIKYKKIKQVNGNMIKYNSNGVCGFSVWKGNRNLEDRIWVLAEAERIAKEI